MAEVGARDRLVMAGLVVLGLLTVVAGVLSGRSTINYVLARDAREAALSWAGKVNSSLGQLGPHAPQFLDQSLEVLNADQFDTLTRLDQLGVPIAMDDFGPGYSSLIYLTPLPGQQDQDRPLLHRHARHQPANLRHLVEHHRPRPVAARDHHRRGR